MTIVGDGDFRYELDDAWPTIPEGWTLGLCSDVAVDSRDRVHVFNRGIHSVAIFDADSGAFLTSWGEGEFRMPHGIFIGPDDSVYLTDRQAHVVTRHTPTGEVLMELGSLRGEMSDDEVPGVAEGRFRLGGETCCAEADVDLTQKDFALDPHGRSPTQIRDVDRERDGSGHGISLHCLSSR